MHLFSSRDSRPLGLNESPYEKVGKSDNRYGGEVPLIGLNESPYEKVGKSCLLHIQIALTGDASMKVPTKK